MKIHIETRENAPELEITIVCSRLTPEVEHILATLRMVDRQLTGRKDGTTYLLDAEKVLYMESVDGKCFLYTGSDVYESPLRLSELEAELSDSGFFRISRSALVNLHCVRTLKADLNRRIRITMENGEQLIASRQYAEALKRKLVVR